VARAAFSHNDKPNRHAWHDVGMAIENLIIQAMALGLWVHQMAGYDAAKARQVFAIPEGYEPVAAIAIGYEGDPQNLPDPLRERELGPRSRKPLSDLVFDGCWGKVSALISPVA
jgi:nitroreductase